MSGDGAFIFFSLFVPGVDPEVVDPEELADDLVEILNRPRPPDSQIMVSGIPAAQWLTPATLANLRAAARGETSGHL